MSENKDVYLEWGPELPSSYDENTVVAMVRDPDCLVFYWDVSSANANAPLVARVHCVRRGTYYDIDLPAFRKPWHLPVESNLDYRVELLARREGDRLELLATSQTVSFPVRHAWQADRQPAEIQQLERQGGPTEAGTPSPDVSGRSPTERHAPVNINPPEDLVVPPSRPGKHYVKFDKDV